MAERGEVLFVKRRMGFAAAPERERVVVLQHDALNSVLATTVVAPLDVERAGYAENPVLIRVSAKEAGASAAHFVVTTHLTHVMWDRLDSGAVGRLELPTLERVDEVLKAILGLNTPEQT